MSKFDQVYKKYLPEALPVLAALAGAARVAAPAIGRAVASVGRGAAAKGTTRGFVAGQALGGGSSGGQAGSSSSSASSGGNLSAPVTTTQSGPNVDQLAKDLTDVSDSNKVKEILAANLK